MWTCPECETRNEDSRKYCDCCGMSLKSVETPKVESRIKRKTVETSRWDFPGGQESHFDKQTTTGHSHDSVRSTEKSKPKESSSLKEEVPYNAVRQSGQKLNLKIQSGGSKWIPLLISVVWIILFFFTNYIEFGNILNSNQKNFQVLLFVSSPWIATLCVCVKGVPGLLKGLGAIWLGFIAAYDFCMPIFPLDMYFNWNLSDSTAGCAFIGMMAFFSFFIGIAAGTACSKIQN